MNNVILENRVGVAKARPVETITPPPGFCYVEECIARCNKLSVQYLSFLRISSVRVFVNVSGHELNPLVQNFASDSSIPVHNIFSGGQSPLTRSVSLCEEFMRSTLELLLELSVTSSVVLIIGSPSHHIDCIIVACLRRVQEWSFVSILGELRMHSACRQFDVEQFIEAFDPDTVDLSTNTPDFLKIHIRLKEEEEKLAHRLENRMKSSHSGDVSGQKQDSSMGDSDTVLGKLFFSSKISALSPGSTYDASISLINDKDDDD